MSGKGVAILEAQPALSLEEFTARMQPHTATVEELIRRYPVKRGALLQVLWLIQEEMGWVPRIGIKWAAKVCDVSPVHAFGVVEFYTMYRQVPAGKYIIRVCHNVSCHNQGAEELIAHLEHRLSIKSGQTTPDSLFSLERVECLAACGNGPAVQINDEFLYGPGNINELEDGWHPSAEAVDAWIERIRDGKEEESLGFGDQLGGIILDTAGHPGAEGAKADEQAANYAPVPPPLKVKAVSGDDGITISWLAAPEHGDTILERSDDEGSTWKAIGNVDPSTIPGPPGPRTCTITDQCDSPSAVRYRVEGITKAGGKRHSAIAAISSGKEGAK